MGSAGFKTSVMHNDQIVCFCNLAHIMGDENNSIAFHLLPDTMIDLHICVMVQTRPRLVEYQILRLRNQCPGNGKHGLCKI